MAGVPDVRVRLSAEGVADVVNAFRRISSESNRAKAQIEGGFGSIKNLLGGVGAAIAGIGFAHMVFESSEAAEMVRILSQRLQTSAQTLTAFDVVMKRSGSSLKDNLRGMTSFLDQTRKAVDDLSGEIADGFRAIGLSTDQIKNFARQDLAQRLQTVGEALQKIPEGPARADAALRALGPRVQVLIPLLDRLGKEGIAGLRKEAEALIGPLDVFERATDLAGVTNDAFDDLKIQTDALVTQFTAGLAPGLSGAMASIQADLRDSGSTWAEFGKISGAVIGFLVAVVANAGDVIGTYLKLVGSTAASIFKGIAAAAKLHFGEAALHFEAGALRMKNALHDLDERTQRRLDRVLHPESVEPRAKFGPTTEEADAAAAQREEARKAAAERRDAERARIDADLALIKAGLALREQEEQRSFDREFTGLREHYERRRKIVVAGINAEITALQKRRVLASQEDTVKARAEVYRIDSQIAALVDQRGAKIAAEADAELSAVRALGRERLAIERRAAEVSGATHAIRMAEIEEEVAKLDEVLARGGGSEEANEAAITSLRRALTARAEFEFASEAATTALGDFERERSAIEDRAAAGLIGTQAAEEKIVALERERIVGLREQARLLRLAAEETGDSEAVARAREFEDGVARVDVAMAKVTNTGARLRTSFQDAVQDGLVTFLSEGITQAKSFEEAMKNMAAGVIAAMRQMLAQMLAARAVAALFNLIPGAKVPGVTGIPGEVGVPRAATGGVSGYGVLRGPGTGTSDSILIAASKGEHFMPAARVAEPGVLAHLEAIRARGARAIPRFAEGGAVGVRLAATPGAGMREGADGAIEVRPHPDAIVRWMRSNEAAREVLRITRENRRAMNSNLGNG